MFKKLFAKFYLIFTGLVVLIGLAIGFIFYVFPFYQKTVANLKVNIKDSSGELKSRSDYLDDLKSVKQEYESIESAKIKKLNLVLPAKKEIPELFLQIQAIANQSGLSVSSINASEIAKKINNQLSPSAETKTSETEISGAADEKISNPSLSDKITTLEVSLSLSGGSYEKLKIFLDKIERNVCLLDIQSISFDNDFKSISIVLNTYFLN